MTQDYTLLSAINGLTALFWLACALSTLATYRTFRQSVDLKWTLAFCAMSFVRLGDAYVANQMAGAIALSPEITPELLHFAAFFRTRFAAIEIAAALTIFFLLRSRRRV